jgi:hypothetical protein
MNQGAAAGPHDRTVLALALANVLAMLRSVIHPLTPAQATDPTSPLPDGLAINRRQPVRAEQCLAAR